MIENICKAARRLAAWGAVLGAAWLGGAAPAAALDYPALVQSYGPVSYWRLGETSGTAAADSTGSNAGTYTNGVLLNQTGALVESSNPAANFDGVDDYVSLGTMDVGGSLLTIVAWFKADTVANYVRLVSKANGALPANHHWALGIIDNTGYKVGAILRTSASNPILMGTTGTVTTNQWICAAMVYNGSTLKVYKDGVEVGSTACTGTLVTSSSVGVRIGANPDNTYYFDGTIDEVAIFSKALSAAQIKQLYRTGRGLVGHWKFDETTGTSAADSSPYANTGTLSGGLSFASHSVTGQYTRALAFNGSTHYVSVANAASLQLTDALTIAGWIKGTGWGSGSDVDAIVRKGDSNPNNYQLAVADGRVALYLDASDSAGVRSNTVLQTAHWYHVAATWDGATVKIYVNGELDASAARSGTIATDTRALYLGGYSGSDLFAGALDDLRIYNYALDQTDIYRLYGLKAYWKFDDASGSQAIDSTGNGYTATLYGDSSWTTGKKNGAIAFDGSGDYARTTTSFPPPADGSIAFWMKAVGTPPARQRVFGLSDAWEVRHETTGHLIFDVDIGGGEGAQETTTSMPANSWRLVVLVYSATNDTYAIYLNGTLHKSGTLALSGQSAAQLSFGVRTGATDYWQGSLDDVRVYDRALAADEISLMGASSSLRILQWIEL